MYTENNDPRAQTESREPGILRSVLPMTLTIATTLTFAFVLIFLAATQHQTVVL